MNRSSCTLGNHNGILEAINDGSGKMEFYADLPTGHEPKGSRTKDMDFMRYGEVGNSIDTRHGQNWVFWAVGPC